MGSYTKLNFSGGPGALPATVLIQAQEAIQQAPGSQQSILGISHRSDWFRAALRESEINLRALLDIPDDYHVLQLQGGSSLQFSMIPILLLRGRERHAEYLRTGYWSSKSIPDARREGRVHVLFDGERDRFTRLPYADELNHDPDAAYLHYISNETVEGLQFQYVPGLRGVPRVCDMSSDFLSRPFDVRDFDLVYAHAQKNLGPSGLTLVLIKNALLERAPADVHSMLDYRNHVAMGSIYNTPPVFSIYVTMLVTRWLRQDIGSLSRMQTINARKAKAVYACIDAHPQFFRAHAAIEHRSTMNVAFRLPSPELEKRFLAEAEAAGFYGLEGHRSLGGLRVSLYNAVTEEDVAQLVEFMSTFQARQRV